MRLQILLSSLAAVRYHFSLAAEDSSCNCDGCSGSSTIFLGRHTDLDSEVCPEGSVATVTKLRTASSSGDYELLTWNTGGSTYTDDILGSPYKYRQATAGEGEEITCFQLNETELPVIGDQRSIQVKLNCESARCKFLYDVQFGCAKTGVLIEDVTNNGGVQVLSDVDDTIKSPYPQCTEISNCELKDLKHYFAGADVRLNDGEFYPGVAEFMLGLALGPGADCSLENSTTFVPAKPMLLSARPNEVKALLGISQDNDLNLYFERVGRGEQQPSFGISVDSSMYGTLFDTTDHTEFGQTKARHFNTVSNEHPNTRFLFMGDNGQGDVCAAQSMLESDNGSRMVAVLIHQTQSDPEKILSECQQPDGEDFTLTLQDGDYGGAVHFHKTHSNAAAWALDRGLISCCSAGAVYNAVAEWAACRCEGTVEVCAYNETFPPPTGPYYRPSVRDAARAYCADVATDQAALASKISTCDPLGIGSSSNPDTSTMTDDSSSASPSRRIPNRLLALASILQGLARLVIWLN